MKKTIKIRLRHLTKKQYRHLKELCNASKNLYNQALYTVRQEYQETEKYLSYNALDKIMKTLPNLEGNINYKLMKAGVSQQILRRLDKSYKSFFQLQKAGYKESRPPKYLKSKYHNLIFDNQRFQIKDGKAVLDKVVSITIPNQAIDKRIVQVEIIPQFHAFYACFVYEDDIEYLQIEENENVMGIDLGLNNLASCATSQGDFFLINGRPLKSINHYYNKQKADIQSELEKRNHSKQSVKLQNLTDKRNNKINDYLHKSSRMIVNQCLDNDISKIVIGEAAKSMSGINLGKRNNQNFINIPLGRFIDMITYKAGIHGIKTIVINESYTSKASFIDNDVLPKGYEPDKKHTFSGKRVKRGLYRTAKGILLNADINGALNIIRKVVPNFNFHRLIDGIEGRFTPHCKLLTCQ
ncbi:Transposase, IS605 family [Desulfonema limicola]|uniref:Transposase, IS605 family n=1 Tax=Desulfonema limicola TaxID=45656 RepID=A0A975BAC1_9BACT|nr:RNA-guided endonuclease TnpB family protein [Desulfonema limicola]QTA81728.1 Transposase, IS605 family [Desulfonema limicola]